MTTNDDQYVPTDEDFIDSWACAHVTPHDMTAEEAKDAARAFLARVRRDAAGSTYAAAYRAGWLDGQNGSLPDPRMAYPEETP